MAYERLVVAQADAVTTVAISRPQVSSAPDAARFGLSAAWLPCGCRLPSPM